MPWLDTLVYQHSELESPKVFWYWSGLATISAIVKDNVWLDRGGHFNTYPNIYVMLHAPSGMKKGAPIALATRLIKSVNNTRIISGRASIQGILKELVHVDARPGQKINTKASGIIIASEFSSSIVEDRAALDILTDLYDRHWRVGDWSSLLKSEKFNLLEPTVSMLVATNAAHFEAFLDNKDLQGGFIGRTFVIAATKVNRFNPLIRKLKVQPNIAELASYLHKLSKLKGPFQEIGDTPAGNLYEEWYMDFHQQVEQQEVEDSTGTIQRFGDSVLKVAMLLSLADEPDLVIKEGHVAEAIQVCEKLLGNVRETTQASGKSSNAVIKGLILRWMLEAEPHEFTRKKLMSKLYLHLDSVSKLDEIMETFIVAGQIEMTHRGPDIVFSMPDKIANEFIKWLKTSSEDK
jgi:hypothetical protein